MVSHGFPRPLLEDTTGFVPALRQGFSELGAEPVTMPGRASCHGEFKQRIDLINGLLHSTSFYMKHHENMCFSSVNLSCFPSMEH